MNKRIPIYIIVSLFLLTSCKSNRLDVQLDNSPISIEFTNADAGLYNQSLETVQENLKNLGEKLGDLFYRELAENTRQNISDSSYQDVYDFYNSEYIKDMEEEKAKLTPNLSKHEERIKKGFQYLNYHFSDLKMPEHIFYINTLFSFIHSTDSEMSVGLENYISPESAVINSIPQEEFYQWQRDRMDIQYLDRDVLMAWIQVHLFDEIDGKLVEHFIQAGKVLYVLNAAFPKETEAFILRYSKEYYEWAKKNEVEVWNYLVAQQLLFSTDVTLITNFLNEGPTTIGLSSDSPDRIGQFIGYKMVKGFMNKNKSLSLQQLLDTGYNNILQTYKID